jgi:cytochrome c biogenesis protein
MAGKPGTWTRTYHTLASVKTGVILLIILVIVSAAGTFILQRPQTDPDVMQRAYSPQALYWLDKAGLTDVFHAWWFVLLMALLASSIILVSVDRFPKAWRLLTRPYRRPEPHFRAALPVQEKIPVRGASAAILAAEQVFRRHGLKPQRIVEKEEVSLFAERNRASVLAVYVVHASLLLILAGGIVDAFLGYRGYIQLTPGQQTDRLELHAGATRALPFTLRCDGTGQENYPDGTPKRWWSKLVVLEKGREVQRKEIAVNDPLVSHGIRFYQSGYGMTGEVESVLLNAIPSGKPGETTQISLRPNQPVTLDPDTTVVLARFIPDFVVRDNEIYARSNDPNNPAIQLLVTSKASGKTVKVWLFPAMGAAPHAQGSPYDFRFADLQMAAFTGLQVSYEPGQWLVWTGCLLMALGLGMAFYLVHQRFWAQVIEDASGHQFLWVGTAADKNREHLAGRFRELTEEIRKQLAPAAAEGAARESKTLVTV